MSKHPVWNEHLMVAFKPLSSPGKLPPKEMLGGCRVFIRNMAARSLQPNLKRRHFQSRVQRSGETSAPEGAAGRRRKTRGPLCSPASGMQAMQPERSVSSGKGRTEKAAAPGVTTPNPCEFRKPRQKEPKMKASLWSQPDCLRKAKRKQKLSAVERSPSV